jgi:hypothetical protein
MDLIVKDFLYTCILFLFFFIIFIGEFPYFLLTLKLFRDKSRWKVVFARNRESRFYLLFVSLVPSMIFFLMSGSFAFIFYLFFNSYILFGIILAYLLISMFIFIRLPADSIKRIDTTIILFVFSRVETEDKLVQKYFFDYPKKLAWIIGTILILIGFFILLKNLII